MQEQRRTTTRQHSLTATQQRPPMSQMSGEELHAWIHTTRAALHKKLKRERNETILTGGSLVAHIPRPMKPMSPTRIYWLILSRS